MDSATWMLWLRPVRDALIWVGYGTMVGFAFK